MYSILIPRAKDARSAFVDEEDNHAWENIGVASPTAATLPNREDVSVQKALLEIWRIQRELSKQEVLRPYAELASEAELASQIWQRAVQRTVRLLTERVRALGANDWDAVSDLPRKVVGEAKGVISARGRRPPLPEA